MAMDGAIGAVAHRCRPLSRIRGLPWPTELSEQVRGVFLAAAVIGNVLVLPTVSPRYGLSAVTSVLAAGLLAAFWVRGFRRRRFAWWSDVVEVGLLALMGLGQGSVSIMLGPIYNGIFFRSLYGGARSAVVRAGAYTALMDILLIVRPVHDHMLQPGPLVGWLLPSLAMCTLTDRMLAIALARREQAGRRERLLTESGNRLLQAHREDEVHEIGLTAAMSLLAGVPAASVALLVAGSDGPQVVATRRVGVAAAAADSGSQAQVIELPVRTDRGAPTSLRVNSSRPLRADLRRSLEALVGQLALGLGGVRLQEEMARRAMLDGLTQLPNRSSLGERLEAALAAGGGIAGVFLDLDDFKTVNDALGHQVGDHLLQAVAGRLQSCMRPGDVVGRLGGDEFAAVLHDVRSDTDAVAAAMRMLVALDQPFSIQGYEIAVRTSVGVAVASRSDTTATLLRNADTAMYVAKAKGKGRCELFTPAMHEAVSSEYALRDDLQHAVEQGQFVLHYQPLVDLDTRAIVGFEALVRWQHPHRGLLPPADFLALAERSGHLHAIERRVLLDACHTMKQWHGRRSGESLTIGVNLSATHLQRRDAITSVRAALDASGLPPQNLFIEITEHTDADDWSRVAATLTQLRALGVRIALDDFGTGYSALSLLAELPVDSIKIDRNFTGNDNSAHLLAAVFDMAHGLGLNTVAEGVERVEQERMLREAGCQLAQGYLYSRPIPADEVPALLASHADTVLSSARTEGIAG
jgi:diguanylate cyclase (GGDEF)-like protein